MDGMITFGTLAEVLKAYGPFGIVVVIWYFDMRFLRTTIEKNRESIQHTLKQHADYMGEIRRMYENNVKLVEGYQSVACDLKDLIVMNTTALTRLTDNIRQNQFCPLSRVDKEKIEVAK